MNMRRKIILFTAIAGVLGGLYGCGEETTAEKAGNTVEKGVKAVQDGASDAAKKGSGALNSLSENVKK